MDDLDSLRAEVSILRCQVQNAHEAMQNFVYAVAHDLGAPLRGVTGFSDIIKRKYAAMLDDQAVTYLDIISRSGEKAQNMLNGLLCYSRVYTQGKRPEHIRLDALARQACDSLQDKIVNTRAVIVIKDLPEILCDAAQIAELFALLIDNALTFMAPDRSPQICISAKETSEGVKVAVEDNGIGVPQKAVRSVFVMFKKLHSDREYPGLGVGLAVANRIVERHRGGIAVEQRPAGGSVFSFSLDKRGPICLEGETG